MGRGKTKDEEFNMSGRGNCLQHTTYYGEAGGEEKQRERNLRRRQRVKRCQWERERKRTNTNLEAKLVG